MPAKLSPNSQRSSLGGGFSPNSGFKGPGFSVSLCLALRNQGGGAVSWLSQNANVGSCSSMRRLCNRRPPPYPFPPPGRLILVPPSVWKSGCAQRWPSTGDRNDFSSNTSPRFDSEAGCWGVQARPGVGWPGSAYSVLNIARVYPSLFIFFPYPGKEH